MNTKRFRADSNYWDQKLANYLHDPPDKALHIPGHEERSRVLLDALGNLPHPHKDFYQHADKIAAGMDRAQLPGHSHDKLENGSVNFSQRPLLTHPTGKNAAIRLDFPVTIHISEIAEKTIAIIHKDMKELSAKFPRDPQSLSIARFHYFHHAFRERLAQENVGDLGSIWHRIPADTRIPDHSIWQHCSLVSALTSCFQLSTLNRASLLVFNITPVQDFIGRARKLRDFWIGSLILSWLTFEGIRQVIYSLGSDHVLYPSLIGQPMVNWLLNTELGLHKLTSKNKSDTSHEVASLPNKFVCLVPTGQEKKVAEDIKQSILNVWIHLGDKTLDMVEEVIEKKDPYLRQQFNRQIREYWNFHWAACPLLDESSQDSVKKLLHENVWQKPLQFLEGSKELPFQTRGEGAFYGITHAMTQSFLAAGKCRRTDCRSEEPGIKCTLHEDMEALRFNGDGGDLNPRPDRDPFWRTLKENWSPVSDFKRSERISAVALVKRLAYRVCKDKDMTDHPLYPFLKEAETFPSTTEMALADWLDRVKKRGVAVKLGDGWRRILSQVVHEREPDEDEKERTSEIASITPAQRIECKKIISDMEKVHDPIRDDDKYYAILLMDGDHMGRLVNGETLASRWETVLHPDLVERLKEPRFDKKYGSFWHDKLGQSRLLSPALHAAISEALAEFSLHTVPRIVNKNKGRLIYAGGDDVCAILPVSTVLQAAMEIAESYSWGFLFFPTDTTKNAETITEFCPSGPGRLALHLGRGEKISISAGILIAHHKKPLSVAMRQVHDLLKRAKKDGNRNGLALELEKRSGGGRVFMAQWKEKPFEGLQIQKIDPSQGTEYLLDHFLVVGEALSLPGAKSMSTSLAYRLKELEPGLQAIIEHAPQELVTFLKKQIERSGKKQKSEKDDELASRVAALIARKRYGAEVDADSLILAKFIGGRIARIHHNQGVQP